MALKRISVAKRNFVIALLVLRVPIGDTSRLEETLQRHDYFFIQRSLKAIKGIIDIPNDRTEEMRVMALTNRVEEILIKVERFKDNEFTKALLEFKYELIVDGITPQLKLLYAKVSQVYQDTFQLYKLRYLKTRLSHPQRREL